MLNNEFFFIPMTVLIYIIILINVAKYDNIFVLENENHKSNLIKIYISNIPKSHKK